MLSKLTIITKSIFSVVRENDLKSNSWRFAGFENPLAKYITDLHFQLPNKLNVLKSSRNPVYITHKLPSLEENAYYYISIQYKSDSQYSTSYSIWDEEQKEIVFSDRLSKSDDWSFYEHDFLTAKGIIDPAIYIYVNGSEQTAVSEIDKIHIGQLLKKSQQTIELKPYMTFYSWSDISDLSQISDVISDESIIYNGSFDNPFISPWKAYSVLLDEDDKQSSRFSLVLNDKDATKAANLSAQDKLNYLRQETSDFDNNSLYELSIDYKNVSGHPPTFALWQKGPNIVQPSGKLESIKNQWDTFKTVFVPSPLANNLALFLYADPKGGLTINTYDNISLRQVSNVDLVTLQTKELTDNIKSHSSVEYERQNNGEYYLLIDVLDQPEYLIFSESYHPKWRLYIEDINGDYQLISKDSHVLVNGYANAWYIDPNLFDFNVNISNDKLHLKIEFLPQRHFFIGLIISGFILIVLTIYLIWNVLNSKYTLINHSQHRHPNTLPRRFSLK